MNYKNVILIILDGFGIAPDHEGNAVSRAKMPNFSQLIKWYPCATLTASGPEVGLPVFVMGNSEVGHMNLGSGRVSYQELPKIDKAIFNKSFFSNPAFLKVVEHVKKKNSKLHFIGLVSEGGVHSHSRHLLALLDLAKEQKLNKVFVHAFLDGRDTPRDFGKNSIAALEEEIKKTNVGKIATLCGRYFAMDRNNHWDRVAKAYNLMTKGEGNVANDSQEAILDSYQKGVYDEEFLPTLLDKNGLIGANDGVIFFNFRTDRAKQLTHAFLNENFDKFPRQKIENLAFATFTKYDVDLSAEIAFSHEEVKNVLGEIISRTGQTQLRIAETEKFAHVTNFFNSERKEPFDREERLLIPSPDVTAYDQRPEMSAQEITNKLVPLILAKKYGFTLLNFANPDMVAHTGNIPATIKGLETVDICLGKIISAIQSIGGAALITADHGNAEIMLNLVTGEIDKEHSTSPVPFIIVAPHLKRRTPNGNIDLSIVSPAGVLSDVAPTILELMEMPQPQEMTGKSLLSAIK